MNLTNLVEDPIGFDVIQAIVDHLPCGVAVFDCNLDVVVCSRLFRCYLDLPDDIFREGPPSFADLARLYAQRGMFGPGDIDQLVARAVQQAAERQGQRREWRFSSGKTLDLEDKPFGTDGLISLCTDITDQRRVEEVLRDRESLLRLIYDNSSAAIFTVDDKGRVDNVNQRTAEMFALPMDKLVRLEYATLVHPSERQEAQQRLVAHIGSAIPKVTLERQFQRGDGTSFWGQISSQLMPGQQSGVVCVVVDITERIRAERAVVERSRDLEVVNRELTKTVAELSAAREALEHLVQYDGLTGARNRARIEEFAQMERLRTTRYGHPVSLIFVDLDHFKMINDTHGHGAGDEVLRAFCDLVRRCIRPTDQLGRWGGEEFLIIVPNSGVTAASLLAERIRKAMANHPFPVAESVTASFGVAEFRPGESWESWLSRADAALYTAKTSGRDRVIADLGSDGAVVQAEVQDAAFLRLIWNSGYESGHAVLDLQHRLLVERANELLAATARQHDKVAIMRQIHTLVSLMAEHFHDEEILLASIGHRLTAEHEEIHERLRTRAEAMREEYSAGRMVVGELSSFFAYDIVATHLVQEDKKYFEAIRLSMALK